LITLGTVAATAYGTSRLAIAEAIRDLPERTSPRRNRWPRTVLLLTMAILGTAMLVPSDPRSRLVGGTMLIAMTAALARGRLPDRTRATLAGLLMVAWAGLVGAAQHGSDLTVNIFIAFSVGIVTAIGLSITTAANLQLVELVVGLLGNRLGSLQATLRPPLAYLARRPVRTGLATTAFALVFAVVSLIALGVGPEKIDYTRESAGFDVVVVSADPEPIQLPPEVSSQVTGQLAIPMRLYQGPLQAPAFGGNGSSVAVMFYVLPDRPGGAGPASLGDRQKRFSSDAEAWQAVRSESGLIVSSWGAGVGPGERETLEGADGPIQLTVAASQNTTILNGLVASPETIARIATQPAGTTLLLRTSPGSDPGTIARQIQRSLFAQGVEATATHEIIDQDHATNREYGTEYDVLLHMGLLVGVLALTMIGIRTAIERRRAIGILRALGYQRPRVVAGLVAESLLTATIGVLTGLGAAVFLTQLQSFGAAGASVTVDLVRLGVALVIVYGTVLMVSVPLAARVARLAPTEAIRTMG
jgi:putative ABC transport system permease protein